MRHVLVITVALLAMPTKAVSAWNYEIGLAQPSDNWVYDCRRGYATKSFATNKNGKDVEEEDVEVWGGDNLTIRLHDKEIRALQKALPKILLEMKKCDAWFQCLADRDRGKVKHCYENDKRWRHLSSPP
jgi:hypothetical protein